MNGDEIGHALIALFVCGLLFGGCTCYCSSYVNDRLDIDVIWHE